MLARSFAERMQLLRCIFSEPALWRAVLVIAPAAAVKSCFESMLPLFGGQKNYDELSVGAPPPLCFPAAYSGSAHLPTPPVAEERQACATLPSSSRAGMLFCVCAVAYILASVSIGSFQPPQPAPC